MHITPLLFTPAPALEIPSECDIIIKYPNYIHRGIVMDHPDKCMLE
jgi:hypothetical protein